MNKNAAVLYDGPSMIDGKRIVAIATGLASGSGNEKTGDMVQTWIMRADIEPHEALKTGDDSSICGGCPHRPIKGGSCYVTVFRAPLSIWRSWDRGNVADGDAASIGEGRRVRLGSYGDPAAVPVEVWQALTSKADGWTGYTHQWRSKRLASGLKGLCQASADSEAEKVKAQADGWGTFRVRLPQAQALPGEIVCPASEEGGKRTTCADCNLCDGQSGKPVVIVVHGAKSKNFKGAK